MNAFQPEGRTGDAAVVFDHLQRLLRFRRDHAAIRVGSLVQLLVEKDRYAYMRSGPGEHVLVVLDRTGSGKVVELEVDDLGLREGLRFQSWQPERQEVVVSGGKLTIATVDGASLYWATR
jgi:glycosidase